MQVGPLEVLLSKDHILKKLAPRLSKLFALNKHSLESQVRDKETELSLETLKNAIEHTIAHQVLFYKIDRLARRWDVV